MPPNFSSIPQHFFRDVMRYFSLEDRAQYCRVARFWRDFMPFDKTTLEDSDLTFCHFRLGTRGLRFLVPRMSDWLERVVLIHEGYMDHILVAIVMYCSNLNWLECPNNSLALESIAGLNNLTVLIVKHLTVRYEWSQLIKDFMMKQLEILEIHNVSSRNDFHALEEFPTKALRYIRLSGELAVPQFVQEVRQQFPTLEGLSLNREGPDTVIPHFHDIFSSHYADQVQRLTLLGSLHLRRYSLFGDELMGVFQSCQSLAKLELENCDGLESFEFLKYAKQMKSLTIGFEEARVLKGSDLSPLPIDSLLEEFKLIGNGIDFDSIITDFLCTAGRNHPLLSVSFTTNPPSGSSRNLSVDSISLLLENYHGIQTIIIHRCPLVNDRLFEVLSARCLPKFSHLEVVGTSCTVGGLVLLLECRSHEIVNSPMIQMNTLHVKFDDNNVFFNRRVKNLVLGARVVRAC